MGKLYFTIGLPRSGKDTFTKKWREEEKNRVVLSGDLFRYAIYDRRYSRVGEELVRASVITAARALLLDGYDVLINDTNTSYTSIVQILNVDENATAYFLDTPAEVCIERAIKTGQEDLIKPINEMLHNLEWTINEIGLGNLKIKNIEVVNAKSN